MSDSPSKIWFSDMTTSGGNSLEEKTNRILERANFNGFIKKKEFVAVKVHVGERGNIGYLNHNFSRVVVDRLKLKEARAFLTDTCTLYSGGRHNAVDHSVTAIQHGYTYESTGAPFIPADGLRGHDYGEVEYCGKRVKKAKIASALLKADKLVFLTHFKGHLSVGFGGTIKNLAMGCASAAGKKDQHSNSKPVIVADSCTGCRQCLLSCPEQAIALSNGIAVIDDDKCVGCGQCVAVCNYNAASVKWDSGGLEFIEKVCEYAAAAEQKFRGKAFYLNFALNITPDCDCWGQNDTAIVQDVGILGSYDPFSLEKATFDMVNKSGVNPASQHAGKLGKSANVFHDLRPHVPSGHFFEYLKTLGYGLEYEIEKI